MALTDYDTLECPHCDQPARPKRINKSGSARYWHDCPDGTRYFWTINVLGEICNEKAELSPVRKGDQYGP